MPRILLVEDNEMNRDMLSRRLARRGFEVVVAVDGKQALELTKSQSPDLILMDMRLPDMNGWEVTRMLKSDGETKHVPVLALTAHAMEGDRKTAIDAGCDDYDTKPVEMERLMGKIRSLLDRGSA